MRNPEIDLALSVANTWAQHHAAHHLNPVEFGHKAALVYRAALETHAKAGDERVMAAALAALSVPAEVWQSLALLSSLARPIQARTAGVVPGSFGSES